VIIITCDLKTTVTVVFSKWFPIQGMEFWRPGNVLADYWSYFHCACTEIAIRSFQAKIWPLY